VVAEGVETEVMFDELERLGCDIAQGYLLSRPLPPDDLTEWAVNWRSAEEEKALVGALTY
jgi:EAL domain-containing protein (putative c-di-GMP-specific phosphodiesterase class I)